VSPKQVSRASLRKTARWAWIDRSSRVGRCDEQARQEIYTLILAADMGVNFYARENNPHVR